MNWILRVDGHTNRIPIKTWAYESTWELSTARATSVVKFLIRLGLAPERSAIAVSPACAGPSGKPPVLLKTPAAAEAPAFRPSE